MAFKREIVNPQDLLKNLKPAIKDPKNILTKDIDCKLTNTKTREALTALIISQVLNKACQAGEEQIKFEICKNKIGEDYLDGYLKLTTKKGEEYIELEQTMLTKEQFQRETISKTPLSELVIDKIEEKHKKRYSGENKIILIIFLDIEGCTIINDIKNYLKENRKFAFYVLVILNPQIKETAKYVYTIVDLNPDRNTHSRYKFEINDDFSNFSIRLN